MTNILNQVDAKGVATITLNRPERHNAFDDTLIRELTAALRQLARDAAVQVVVLTSTGQSFSAGADLGWMRSMAGKSPAENLADARALAELMHTLDRLEKPTIARVQGAAFGGGLGLIACCDVAIADRRARFCLSEVRLGLTPATISPYVVAAIGARQARRYFTTAEVFDAPRAREIGLVHEVVPEGELDIAIDGVVRATLQGAPGAQAEAKALVFLCAGRAIDAACSDETSRLIAARRTTAEAQEGLAAFLDKRAPAWRGEA